MKIMYELLNELNNLLENNLYYTHNGYFMEILHSYNPQIGNLMFYSVLCIKGNEILLGRDDKYVNINQPKYLSKIREVFRKFEDKKALEEFEDDIIILQEVFQIYFSSKSEGYIYLPVSYNGKFLYFTCIKNKKEFMKLLNLTEIEDIYSEYPLLMFILNWGISYIYSADKKERIQECIVGMELKSANYIHEKYMIAEKLFNKINMPFISTIDALSMWAYEGIENSGYMDFLEPNVTEYTEKDNNIDVIFEDKINLFVKSARKIRKYLELSDEYMHLKVYSCIGYISGVPRDQNWFIQGLGAKTENVLCAIQFRGYCKWEAYLKNECLQYDGKEFQFRMNQEEKEYYLNMIDDYYREFAEHKINYKVNFKEDIKKLVAVSARQKHGTMVVISNKAEMEARRLCDCGRGIKIKPINLHDLYISNMDKATEIIYDFTKIDGAIMVDENCVCYAIGVILDGRATPQSNHGRGARFNSGLTYVCDCNEREIRCLCVIVSEDGTVDVFGKYGIKEKQI